MFEAVEADKARAIKISDSMNWLAEHEGLSTRYLLDSYPWSECSSGHLVDVGGGQGHVDVALAQAYPDMKFTVQDLSDAVIKGQAECPLNLKHRIEYMQHDFFAQQPVKGADIYFLRFILHDWSDKYARKIIENLVPALKSGMCFTS